MTRDFTVIPIMNGCRVVDFIVVPELPDAGRDGNDLKTIHDAGAQSADALSLSPVSPFHATGDTRG